MEKSVKKGFSSKGSKAKSPKTLDERAKLDLDIAKAESEITSQQSRNRYPVLVVLAITLLVSGFLYWRGDIYLRSGEFIDNIPFVIFALAYGLLVAGYMFYTHQSRLSTLRADLDLLYARKRILFQFEAVDKSQVETTPA